MWKHSCGECSMSFLCTMNVLHRDVISYYLLIEELFLTTYLQNIFVINVLFICLTKNYSVLRSMRLSLPKVKPNINNHNQHLISWEYRIFIYTYSE